MVKSVNVITSQIQSELDMNGYKLSNKLVLRIDSIIERQLRYDTLLPRLLNLIEHDCYLEDLETIQEAIDRTRKRIVGQ